jgi:hypothetical protein
MKMMMVNALLSHRNRKVSSFKIYRPFRDSNAWCQTRRGSRFSLDHSSSSLHLHLRIPFDDPVSSSQANDIRNSSSISYVQWHQDSARESDHQEKLWTATRRFKNCTSHQSLNQPATSGNLITRTTDNISTDRSKICRGRLFRCRLDRRAIRVRLAFVFRVVFTFSCFVSARGLMGSGLAMVRGIIEGVFMERWRAEMLDEGREAENLEEDVAGNDR